MPAAWRAMGGGRLAALFAAASTGTYRNARSYRNAKIGTYLNADARTH